MFKAVRIFGLVRGEKMKQSARVIFPTSAVQNMTASGLKALRTCCRLRANDHPPGLWQVELAPTVTGPPNYFMPFDDGWPLLPSLGTECG